ncbi:hypothetical protein SERLA73DRAFT_64928 [Serpula lacrymans var. lacrymans S7.3]|uniref:Protein kinase domain-containing protein n=1 Tax=Serpula lacrymans var. lacrymans (strain S7.3) TaxID=936435 RepID=F8QFF6_SERL3|nr:hypothetical protein SERLA73DRAFT_64928 [Serpula lacrymans var. lacrymans S7.3]
MVVDHSKRPTGSKDANNTETGDAAEATGVDVRATKKSPGASSEVLSDGELWWHNHFQWFKDLGYLLRPRYAPGWVPSWKTSKKKLWYRCEDAQIPWISCLYNHILDATRIDDGSFVTLKVIVKSRHPFEVDIARYCSSESISSHPNNHCIPVYDVLQVPEDQDKVVMVMPLLRMYNDPPFDTFGEAVECFRQLFEGLQFIHKHHVAHRDCMTLNIMVDPKPLCIDAFHPYKPFVRRDFKGYARYRTRTQSPPKYFFIDFGISRRYDPGDEAHMEDPIWGGDKTVPEFQTSVDPQNPYYTDVYYLGNVIREDFIEGKIGFEFMIPLVTDMVQDDPAKRPSMDEVVARFEGLRKELGTWKLRSRVIDKEDDETSGFFNGLAHWTRRVSFVIRGVPAVPMPTS